MGGKLYTISGLYLICVSFLNQYHKLTRHSCMVYSIPTCVTCGCSVASNWQPGRPRSDLHSPPSSRMLLNPVWQGRSTMFLRCLSSCDLNLSIEQEDTMCTYLGNLLNILMERHLKLL